jgi:hypothetical protein
MPKKTVIRFRVDEADASRIQTLADLYAKGNLSEWCRYAALEANRMFLDCEGKVHPAPERETINGKNGFPNNLRSPD